MQAREGNRAESGRGRGSALCAARRGGAFLYAFLLAVGVAAAAADGADRQESRVRAERLVDRVIDGEPVTCMYGNVFIDRDTVTAAGDTAFYYRQREVYEFRRNVRLTRLDAVLTCERAVYQRDFGTGEFYRDVRLVDGDLVGTGSRGRAVDEGQVLLLWGDALLVTPEYSVRADTVRQNRDTGEGEAFGNVRILEPGARNLVTGDHAVFDRASQTAVVDRNPVLTSREQSGGPLVATSGIMRMFRDENRMVMTDSVHIRQALMNAHSDTAVAYGRELLVLTGAPHVSLGDGSTMQGERIEFHYTGGALRRIELTGAARMEDSGPDSLAAVYPGLPDMDVLEGDSISIDFEDEVVRRSVVVGGAHSRYTPLDLTDEIATNDVRGDTIIIHFRDRKVRRVNVFGRGEGRYRFASLAAFRSPAASDTVQADSLSAADSLAVDPPLGAVAGLAPDTVAVAPAPGDTLAAVADSAAAAPAAVGSFDQAAQAVDYAGGEVTFELSDRTMELKRDASLTYGTLNMTAQHVILDTDSRELYADGQPVVEDSETIAGERMGYNFKHKSAAVESGVTAFDEYYYVGDDIRRFDDQTMKICGGRMSSCDLAEPHYHFWSNNMKMRPGDKVVAAPIVMRVGRVPVFALPFYFKSLKSGRQSGILFPSFDFGWSSREGRYIRDWGYYWATNDYLDFLFEGDYNERREFGFRVSNRYVKRYSFNGGVDYSRRVGLAEGDDTREWQFLWNHNQPTLFDDYKFRADVRLSSRTLSSNDLAGSSRRDIVSGQRKSTIYLSRNWSFMSASLNASQDGRVNAEDDNPATDNLISSTTLPSLSLNFRQITLAPALRGGARGSFLGNLGRSMYFQQGYSVKQDFQVYELRDVTTTNAQGNWSLSLRPPRVGIFNLSFAASGRQAWQRVETEGEEWVADTDSTGHYDPLYDVREQTSPGLSLSTSLGTTLYGLFPVQVGRLQALRHTVRFNSGWSVTPALGDKQAHSTRVSLQLDQRFDLKYLTQGPDSTMTEQKLDGLIDWSLNTSYNPKAPPGDRWSEIGSGLTVKPGQSRYLQLKVNNTIDPKSLALTSTRFTYGFNFQGRLDLGQVAEVAEAPRNEAIERLGVDLAAEADSLRNRPEGVITDEWTDDGISGGEDDPFDTFYQRPGRQDGGPRQDPTEGGRYLPFRAGASLSYSYSNASRSKRANANFNLQANVTRNWDVNYTASYDIAAGEAVRQQLSVSRDLHCWRLEFTRTVSAVDSSFGFRLYLRSIPSLKFARGREDYMGLPGGGFGGLY